MTGPQPASVELAALAVKARPEWSSDSVWAALGRAHHTGMTWGQIYAVMGRLLADPDGTPDDLAAAAPELWRRPRRAPAPDTAHRGAALARAALHTTDDDPPEGG